MKVTKKKLKDYLQDKKNFNKGTEFGEGLIEKSVSRFGAGRSMLASSDGVLIAGNKSHQKLAEAGIENVIEVETDGKTAVVVKRTDIKSGTKKFHELALADNATSKANLNFDETLVEEILTEEVMLEWGVGQAKAEEDDYKAPPLEEIKTDIVKGDIFEITDGKLTHRLLCGDSTVKDDVEKLLVGNKPNLMITDPPYNVDYEGNYIQSGKILKKEEKIWQGGIDNDNIRDFTAFLVRVYQVADEKLTDGAAIYIWHPSGEQAKDFWLAWLWGKWHF